MLDGPLLERKLHDPHWTSPQFSEGGARDALGVETLSEAILADLLPGINNQTGRARYYSFWAWVLRDFILDERATHTQMGFYEWLRRREDTLILANLHHDCGVGAAGTTQGAQVWQDGSRSAYDVTWKSLLSVSGGAYQLYYRGVLQEMNITLDSGDGPHDELTKTLGVPLADAYAASVAETAYVRRYLDAAKLSKPIIEDFAGHGCLCELHQHEAERKALVAAFFRFDSPDAFAVRRLASLCFFLDVIEQSNGQPLTQMDMRKVMYFWSFGTDHAYQPVGNLLEPAQRWRCFQLRQWFVFALESLWSRFLKRIEVESLRGSEYMAWLLPRLNLTAMAQEFGAELPHADARSLPARVFYEAVRDALPAGALKAGPLSLSTPLNEGALADPIWRKESETDVQVRVGHALLMLVLMYYRCQPWQDQPGWRYLSNSFGAGRLPVEGYLHRVDRALAEDWSLSRWLGWLHSHCLWLQHRRVALQKLASRSQETASFEVADEEEGEGIGALAQTNEPLFRGLRTDSPKMNAPRFPSALRILADLRLIEPLSTEGYGLLADGKALLDQFRNYSVPTVDEAESV